MEDPITDRGRAEERTGGATAGLKAGEAASPATDAQPGTAGDAAAAESPAPLTAPWSASGQRSTFGAESGQPRQPVPSTPLPAASRPATDPHSTPGTGRPGYGLDGSAAFHSRLAEPLASAHPGTGRQPLPSVSRHQAGAQRRTATGPQPALQPRRARLHLHRIEPWSVMKFSFLLSLVIAVIMVVAVSILYAVLSKIGVFHSIEHTWLLVTTTKSNPNGSNVANWFRESRVIGYTVLIAAVNVVLMTALATIGAVLYNLIVVFTGGVEVTLKESE